MLLFDSLAWVFRSQSREDIAYEQPTLISPRDSIIYYSNEQVTIKWTLPDSLTETDLQDVFLKRFYGPKDHKAFDTLRYHSGYGNQFVHIISFEGFPDTLFYGYRIRSRGPSGVSDWTIPRSVAVVPINNLTHDTVLVAATFSFVTEEHHTYYSGVAVSDIINFDSAIALRNISVNDVKLVRPVHGEIVHSIHNSKLLNDFSRIAVGFPPSPDNFWPFDVLADTYTGATSTNADLTFYPYGGVYRNLRDNLNSSAPIIKLAYFLADTSSPNNQHDLTVNLTLDVGH